MLLCTSYGADDDGDDEIRLIWFAVKLKMIFFVETTLAQGTN